jgi:hypothetical protein
MQLPWVHIVANQHLMIQWCRLMHCRCKRFHFFHLVIDRFIIGEFQYSGVPKQRTLGVIAAPGFNYCFPASSSVMVKDADTAAVAAKSMSEVAPGDLAQVRPHASSLMTH